MSTVALDIWTGAYPSITHDITIKVYAQSAPLAVVASLTHTPPHLADSWSFPGLDRTNYLFRIFETNDGTILQQLGGDMNVIPGSAGGVNYRATEQIQADVTVGVVSGLNTFTLDGTSGSEDWRGWDFDTIDRIGTGPMKRNVDYTWVPATAKFTLLAAGDLIASHEWFNVQFAAQIVAGSSSVPTNIPRFFTPKIITANYNIDAGADMGGLLIIDPATNYIELQLPDITTVVAGRVLDVEMRRQGFMKCMKLKTLGSDYIDWLQGARPDLYACPQESFSIYKFTDPSGPTDMWRIYKPDGNFRCVGQWLYDDADPGDVYNNKILGIGSSIDKFQFARLYNDYVLNLPPSQVCSYDSWATGNNKYKFSFADSADPTKVNQFHIPDRSNTTDKTTDGTLLPGAYQPAQVGAFALTVNGVTIQKSGTNNKIIALGNVNDAVLGTPAVNLGTVNAGLENRVASVISRKYILV